jgi:hypothetical protein
MPRRLLIFSTLSWLFALAAVAQSEDWKVIEKERGITVSRRDVAGCSLPAFRGKGNVEGGVTQMLAMMVDVGGVTEWAYGVDEARVIKRLDESTDVIYLYSDLPWPVRDRDMIVRRTIKVLDPGKEFEIQLRCHPKAEPERDGVVRVKKCDSTFHLLKVDASITEVDYTMRLDPAGLLPAWAGSWVAQHVPFKTLLAIESYTASTRAKYAIAARKWSQAM